MLAMSKSKRKVPLPSEHDEQVSVAAWLRLHKILFTATANGAMLAGKSAGARMGQWRKLQRSGVAQGIPDLLIFDPPPAHPGVIGCAVEMKRQKGGVVSIEQESWISELRSLGWSVFVARGADEAIRTLRDLGYGAKR